jgi:peroxiredoxin
MAVTNLQLGSLVLNAELLVVLAAGLMGLFAVRLRLRGRSERDTSPAWNAIGIWIAVWKGSLILTDAVAVIRQPLSLLYYDGGTIGFWLACVCGLTYLQYRYGKMYGAADAWRITGAFAAGWSTVYLMAIIILDRASAGYAHWLGMFVSATSVFLLAGIWRIRPRKAAEEDPGEGSARAESGLRRMAVPGAGLALLLVLVSYMAFDQTERLMERIENRNGNSGVGARAGNIAPAFELNNLLGEEVALADNKGRTVLVNFWTTWCRVCMTEMPHVQKLHEDYMEQGGDVAILSINVTSQEQGEEQVRQYVEKRSLDFPIVLDRRGRAADAYRVAAYPATFIVDGDGIIRERFLGAISYDDMKKRIERVRDKYPVEQ